MSNAVISDYKTGEALGVNSTPTLIINGQLYPGARSVEELDGLFGKLVK
jgi:protein-disulfide isomerase